MVPAREITGRKILVLQSVKFCVKLELMCLEIAGTSGKSLDSFSPFLNALEHAFYSLRKCVAFVDPELREQQSAGFSLRFPKIQTCGEKELYRQAKFLLLPKVLD